MASNTTGTYTLTITPAAAPPPGPWAPQISVSVPDGDGGNADPTIFGRYLTGNAVSELDVPFTVFVVPSTGHTARAVCFDLNFDGQREDNEKEPGTSGSWTLDVSHDAGLRDQRCPYVDGLGTSLAGTWSTAKFTIQTLAEPDWLRNARTHTVSIVNSGAAIKYRVDAILSTSVFPSFNVPNWPVIKDIADKMNVTTLLGLDLGAEAVFDVSLDANQPPAGVIILGLIPNILGLDPFVPLAPPLAVSKVRSDLGVPDVVNTLAGASSTRRAESRPGISTCRSTTSRV